MEKLLLDIPAAANVLSISRSALYELLGDGTIRSIKIGKSRRVEVASIQSYVASLLTQPTQPNK